MPLFKTTCTALQATVIFPIQFSLCRFVAGDSPPVPLPVSTMRRAEDTRNTLAHLQYLSNGSQLRLKSLDTVRFHAGVYL